MNVLQQCPVCLAWVATGLVGHMCEHRRDSLATTILAVVKNPTTITTNASPTPPQGPDATPAPGNATSGIDAVSAPAEPSLVALDQSDEAVRALIAWRQIDRQYPPEDPRSYAATLRLRDVADRIELNR